MINHTKAIKCISCAKWIRIEELNKESGICGICRSRFCPECTNKFKTEKDYECPSTIARGFKFHHVKFIQFISDVKKPTNEPINETKKTIKILKPKTVKILKNLDTQ